MSARILKYVMPQPGVMQGMMFPRFGKQLHLALQGDNICLWCEVPEPAGEVPVTHIVLPTGAEVPNGGLHLGTVVTPSGFVWHVYRLGVS